MKILDVPQSGSVAGVTSSRNRYGQYRRTRAQPTNPQTVRQQLVRARLDSLATQWRALNSTQRAGWAGLAAQMPRTDSLGQTYTLTGFQLYVSANSVLLNVGAARQDDAPTLPLFPAGFFTSLSDSLAAGHSAPTTSRIHFYATPPLSPGVTYVSDFRWLTSTTGAPVSTNLLSLWEAKFGSINGQRVAVRARWEIDGLLSTPEERAVIVATV